MQFVARKLRELKQAHMAEMRKLSREVDVPVGRTCELVFIVPFEVEDHFVNEDGDPTELRKYVDGVGQVFWLKKRGMLDDSNSDIELEFDIDLDKD
jgi:hypothetical protein